MPNVPEVARQVEGGVIEPEAITASMIAAGAVTEPKHAAKSVTPGKTEAGAWTGVELPAAVETVASSNEEGSIRQELGGALRMRGILKIKTGKEVKSGELIATLPSAFRKLPANRAMRFSTACVAATTRVCQVQIETENGHILPQGTNFPEGAELYLDGICWQTT